MRNVILFLIYSLLFVFNLYGQTTGNTRQVVINGQTIKVLNYKDLNTLNGTLRCLFVTNDIDMPDCAANFGFVIENLEKKQRLIADAWGFNGIDPPFNSNGNAKYFYNPEFGEKIYLTLGISGCGSGYTLTNFEVKYIENGRRAKLEKLFQYNENAAVVYEPRTARIYLLQGLDALPHYGADRKYEVSVYSMVHNNRQIHFTTKRKYKDVKGVITPEKLLAQIKQYESF